MSNVNCCVYGCHSRKGRDKELSYHAFPQEKSGFVYLTTKLGIEERVDRKKAWQLKLLMAKSKPTNSLRVCSLHFEKSDYILSGIASMRPRLKKNAVPSLKLPVICFNTKTSRGSLHKKHILPESTMKGPDVNEQDTSGKKDIGINNSICPKARTEQYNGTCNTKPVETKRNLQTTQHSSSSHTDKILSNAPGINGSFTIVDINDIMKGTSEPQQNTINLTQKSTVISSKSDIIASSEGNCSKTESVSKTQSILKSTSTVTSSKSDIINIDENCEKTECASKTQPLHNISSITSCNVNCNNNIVIKQNNQFPLSTETLTSLINSLPKLQYDQCYLINLPNKIQLLVKATVANTNVLPNNQSTSKEQPSTPLHNKPDKTHSASIKKPKRIKSTNPNPYRCVQVKKSNFKIDSHGFTYFDRHGFFKAEERRSRRCVTMLNLHIEVRDKLLLSLEKESENKRIARLSKKQIEKRNHKIRKNKNKLHTRPSSPTNKETAEIKQHKRYAKKYKLKDCSIVLSKREVSKYLAKKGKKLKRGSRIKKKSLFPNKYSVSHLKVPVYHSNVSLEELFAAASDSLITFIDDNNFELTEKLHLLSEKMYFINSHEIVTDLYTDIFPVFLAALQSNQIGVVEKEIFNKFLAASTVKQETSTNLNTSNSEKDRIQDKDKFDAFCDFMIDFHAAQEKSQCESTVICVEHNYSLKEKV